MTALGELGRLEAVDDAVVALCRSCADAVDAAPRAGIVKEYRECLMLLSVLGKDAGNDAFAELMADVSRAALGDTPESEA